MWLLVLLFALRPLTQLIKHYLYVCIAHQGFLIIIKIKVKTDAFLLKTYFLKFCMYRWLKKHVFEKEILCNINAFTVTFEQFNASKKLKLMYFY